MTTRIGGCCASMVRICTGLVWVRRTLRAPSASGAKKKVSCISRAGWPTGKFSMVKLYSSVSMSGPSATAKPISAKIAVISSMTWLIGWIRPASMPPSRAGSVTSTASVARRLVEGGGLQQVAPRGQRIGDAGLGGIDGGARHASLLRRHPAEPRQQLGERALLAERADAHGLEVGFVGGGRDLGDQPRLQAGKVGRGGIGHGGLGHGEQIL